MMRPSTRYFVKSIGKASSLLQVLRDRGALGLSEITQYVDFDKTSVYRLLITLVHCGWVQQDTQDRKYRLGLQFIQYSNAVVGGLRMRDQALTFMEDLRDGTRETVNLASLDAGRILCVESMQSPQALRVQFSLGQEVLPHCTALGKAIIAFIPEQDLSSLVGEEPFPRLTANTITDYGRLKSELLEIRQTGFAIDDCEFTEDTRCVATAILDHDACVVGGLSVSAPLARLSRAQAEDLGVRVRAAGLAISARLGYTATLRETRMGCS